MFGEKVWMWQVLISSFTGSSHITCHHFFGQLKYFQAILCCCIRILNYKLFSISESEKCLLKLSKMNLLQNMVIEPQKKKKKSQGLTRYMRVVTHLVFLLRARLSIRSIDLCVGQIIRCNRNTESDSCITTLSVSNFTVITTKQNVRPPDQFIQTHF